MPRKNFYSEGAKNPFEGTGIDRSLVGELLDDDSLLLVLKSLRRSVTKALHPDVSGGSTSKYYDDFISDTQKLIDLNPSDRQILAKAYVASKSVNRSRQENSVYKSEDFHDGRLLKDIGEMVAESGVSIDTAKNSFIMIRSLNFSDYLPQEVKEKRNSSEDRGPWYPPESAKVYCLDISAEGLVSGIPATQASLVKMFKRKMSVPCRITDNYKNYSEEVPKLLAGQLLTGLDIDSRNIDIRSGLDHLIVEKRDGRLKCFQPSEGHLLRDLQADDDIEKIFDDGVYVVRLDNSKANQKINLADTIYLVKDMSVEANNLLVIGSVAKDFINIEAGRVNYARRPNYFEAPSLPTRETQSQEIITYPVIDPMLKHAQKYYSPFFDNQSDYLYNNGNVEYGVLGSLLAVDSDSRQISVVGPMIHFCKAQNEQ
jgi:hypothetical protein